MELLMILFGLAIIGFGIFVFKNPEKMNEIRDKNRFKEKLEYTEQANNQMVSYGVILMIMGVLVVGFNLISLF